MNPPDVQNLLSEGVFGPAETTIRQGGVSVGYVNERYGCRRRSKTAEAE